IRCEVTESGSVKRSVETSLEHFGRLDGLVHNAAAPSMDGTVIDLAAPQWQLEIDVILTGAFLASKHALPSMIEGGGGSARIFPSFQTISPREI
ncbi:SDR family oxidoreductase, partial [Rhizobium johnstonii]|uniref:SDR family oxidoreductase n=1 Tax=Rhizobium johnstonii TaxID=3019933 RepID=UPI003F9EB22F